ncbi:hypothetical protein B0A52_04763 [Exophiala mesophila]|uniref:Phosducin domain-containing protein n=1 Tax=Exophiala mesophila TaxID=212818 RepID=A0A438N5Y9_EXOME|nr:hypothetical protein B0A52_04763 [Exophiala mesophila]
MADLAREEADRYFSHRDHLTSHPEDRDNSSRSSSEDPNEPNFDGSRSDPGTDDDDDDRHNMATITSTKANYNIPSQTQYANTGPKGVIADAQSFARAKQTTFRQRLVSFGRSLANAKPTDLEHTTSEKHTKPAQSTASDSDSLGLSDEDADSEFMKTWRANRLQELSNQSAAQYSSQRRQSPSQRTWGVLAEVDANGYLDAIEKVSDESVVVVMIYDPGSTSSNQVQDELTMLAYKHNKTRFVMLHHEIAEMDMVEIPAILAYKAGDVIATISGAKAEGLEETLLQ